jgi:hypothetical protein
MNSLKHQPSLLFAKRRHVVALVVFATSWCLMLVPVLFWPDSNWAINLTLTLLTTGCIAVASLLLPFLVRTLR